MIKKLVIGGGLLLGISNLLSRILGLVRDHLLGTTFGALSGSGLFDLDTYYAAFRLPDFLFNLLIYGTLSAAFVPIFVQYLKKDKIEEAWKFASSVMNIAIVLIFAVCAVVFIFAPWIVPVFVPGFGDERLALTIQLTRIILISPIFFTVSAVFQSIQNSFKTFFFYALAPLVYNLSIIGGIIFLSPRYGVIGVAWGVVAGSALHALVQVPSMIKNKFHNTAVTCCVCGLIKPSGVFISR